MVIITTRTTNERTTMEQLLKLNRELRNIQLAGLNTTDENRLRRYTAIIESIEIEIKIAEMQEEIAS